MMAEPFSAPNTYKDLTIQQLRTFCEVCRLGGYAPAARSLLMSTPGIWGQLKKLEAHLNVVLFERRGNRVVPSVHGRRLLDLVRPALASLESTRDVLHQRHGVFPERLSITTNLRVLVEEISRAMALFNRGFPNVQLSVFYTGIDEIQPRVLESASDVTLTTEPGPDEPISAGVEFEPAGELDYLLVTPPRHVLLRKKSFQIESLVKHPLVVTSSDTRTRHRINEVFHRLGLTDALKQATETSSDEYTVACVRAGLGIGIAVGNPKSVLYHSVGVRSLRRWVGTARIGFMWRRGAHIPPLQRELADVLKGSIFGAAQRSV